MARRPYTLVLEAGTNRGELSVERAHFMRSLGKATLCPEHVYYGNGNHVDRSLVRVVPALTDRVVALVVADSMARVKALLGERFASQAAE